MTEQLEQAADGGQTPNPDPSKPRAITREATVQREQLAGERATPPRPQRRGKRR